MRHAAERLHERLVVISLYFVYNIIKICYLPRYARNLKHIVSSNHSVHAGGPIIFFSCIKYRMKKITIVNNDIFQCLQIVICKRVVFSSGEIKRKTPVNFLRRSEILTLENNLPARLIIA